MRIVIINTYDKNGGAAIAAYRLMKALKKSGQDVQMLVLHKQTTDKDICSVNNTFTKRIVNYIRFVWERVIIYINNYLSKENLFAVSIANTGINIKNHPLIKQADILHLHWINQGFLSIQDIKSLINLNKPIVWTAHDMWPFTGICHYAGECEKFLRECSDCPYLKNHNKKDLAFRGFHHKKEIYSHTGISFVCCSQWLKQVAVESTLGNKLPVYSIPNPIDTEIFCPIDKETAKKELNLPTNKKLILFGALNVTDKRKGINYLIEALKIPDNKQDIELVVFGQVKAALEETIPVKIHSMGYFTDEKQIALLYSAVEVFVISSLEDNLPNTVMEAMACGTPCVGFNTGGIPEMIDHKENGYIANYKDSRDLAEGIQWVIYHKQYAELSQNAFLKVNSRYREEIIANKYLNLYRQIL